MAAATQALAEADLHGLVDGHLDTDRRSDILRRLAASPEDRARVEAWQAQNDLIKGAFQDIERESLPAILDLTPPPALRCITASEPSFAPIQAKPSQHGRIAAGLATVLLIVAGLGWSWMLANETKEPPLAEAGSAASDDDALASRTAQALVDDVAAAGAAARRAPPSLDEPLPTPAVPDLGSVGFVLTAAETATSTPASLVFHYRDAAAERVVISVARGARGASSAAPVQIGKTYRWSRHDNSFAIAGTVAPERLRAIALALQDESGEGPAE